nr:MAG TPA: hypothetical protein [Caudoviricetes sp.]
MDEASGHEALQSLWPVVIYYPVRLITILLYQISLHFTQLGGFSYA